MPAMKYLRFYLDRDCVIVPGSGQTKKVRKGCGSWKLADTQRNLEMLKYNAQVVNGTGGLLIVDVDPKNGGSVEMLRRRFPDLPDTRTVQTVTPHPAGFGAHLIFTIPDYVRVSRRQLGPGIDVPPAVMLAGSVVRCRDGVRRRYQLINEMEPAPAPLALIAAVAKGDDSFPVTPVGPDDSADATVDFLVGRFADAGPGLRNDTFLQVAPTVIRLRGAEGADMLRAAYSGEDDAWLESALKNAQEKFVGAGAPNSTLPSRYAREALAQVVQEARYGIWRGARGATDRKVLLGVIRRCASAGRMTASASVRALALVTGLEPKTVNSAVGRLTESGRLSVVRIDDEGVPEYTPIVGELTTVNGKGKTPIGIGRGRTPLRGFPVDPLHDVWLGGGLTGRHSHVCDLVSVGVRRAKEIATAGGMGYDTARDALATLVEARMLERQGTPTPWLPTLSRSPKGWLWNRAVSNGGSSSRIASERNAPVPEGITFGLRPKSMKTNCGDGMRTNSCVSWE
jgi:hypothetical protein